MQIMDFKVLVQLTPDDFMAWLRHYFLCIPQGRRRSLLFLTGALLAYILFMIHAFRTDSYEGLFVIYLASSFLVLAIAFITLIWAFSTLLTQILLKFTARKVLLEPVTYFFTPESIRVLSPSGQGKIPWKLVRGWEESKKHVFLYLGGISAIILPKDKIDNADALRDAVLELVRKNHTTRRSINQPI